jgi:hypothetical protein
LHLKHDKVPGLITTAVSSQLLYILLQVCGDDPAVVGRGKPRPDIFIEALRQILVQEKLSYNIFSPPTVRNDFDKEFEEICKR